MAQTPPVPRTLKEFLAHGIEPAQCSICYEPYNFTHTAIRIRGCGHEFGRICLEKWLQQSDATGTCPHCRGVLFNNPEKIESEALEEMREDFVESGRQVRFAQGRVLRLLDLCDPHGILMSLWRDVRQEYGLLAREHLQNAWSRGIRALVLNLTQIDESAGGTHSSHDIVILDLYIHFPYERSILELFPASTPETCPFDVLCRNFIRVARLLPSLQNPNSILLRALIMFQIRNPTTSMATALQDIDDDLLKAGSSRYSVSHHPDWRTPVSRLYLLLILLAHDYEYNLRFQPLKVYDREDVARVLRLLERPIFFGETTNTMPLDSAFCERVARFYHLSKVGQPQDDNEGGLLDPYIGRRTICTHVQGLWAWSKTPGSAPWDGVTGPVDYSSDSEDEDGFADWDRAQSEIDDLDGQELPALLQLDGVVHRTVLEG